MWHWTTFYSEKEYNLDVVTDAIKEEYNMMSHHIINIDVLKHLWRLGM